MKKNFTCLLLLFWYILCMTGCGAEVADNGTQQVTMPVNWKQEGFAVSGEVEKEQEFWVQEFIPWRHEEVVIDPETEKLYDDSFICGAGPLNGKIYRLSTVCNPPYMRAVRWILEIYDTENMQVAVREFTPEQLGQGEVDSEYFLVDMDLVDTENFVFQWTECGRNEQDQMHQTVNRIIYSDLQGDTASTELWDTCLEQGIFEDEYSDYLVIPSGNCVCDGAGNIYIRAGKTGYGFYSWLAVFDREGKLLLDYHGSQEQIVEEPLRMETGEMIYPVYDIQKKAYDLMWADVQTGEMKLLASFDSGNRIQQMYGMQENNVYYEMSEGIVQWDTVTGKRTLVFGYQENGIGTGWQTMLAFREGKPPVLRLYRTLHDQTREDWLAPLSEDVVVGEEAVQIVDLIGGSGQVSECAALVSRRDLNRRFTYKSVGQGQDAEDFRTRIFAELAAGKGPDILYVSRSDMKILHEAGVLLNLREVIPEETLDDLLPGVISLGTLDGRLEGMAGGVMVDGLAVSSDVWGENTWRLEDFTALVEEGKLEGLIFSYDSYFAPLATTLWLTEYAIQDSFLIDWEDRECHFEDERYIRFLEAANVDRAALDVRPETILKGGERVTAIYLTRYDNVTDSDSSFVRIVKEGGNFVGFPTGGAGGNYLDTPGVLVVNANTDKTEAVRTFLEYFLGDEIQSLNELNSYSYDTFLGVRKLSLDELEKDEDGRYLWRGEEVSVFEDGTTMLHRAKEFVENCVPAPIVDPVVSQILREELDALYSDNSKDPRTAADIIDSRIQIYLDEE